jgi:taurine--2-oxoglutarate transaminase
MNQDEMIALCKRHTMFSWAAQAKVQPLPIERAEGVHFYAPDGRRFLDFNSQVMSVNIGHSHPKVKEAIKAQIDRDLLYVYPHGATEPRARLGKLLAEMLPGDIDRFFFTTGGAEANENAVKAARLYTGRYKILARYRSYHGATHAAVQLTGDPRRLPNEPGMPGVVHVMDPVPYRYSFGETEDERTANNLRYLEEIIDYEGPDQIAAFFIESVTGTNGVLAPPKGYLEGVRAITEKHGILLVCDEVMAGFGRTGKNFGFEHAGIVPDIVTMAKGMTSSYLPMGAMGLREKIAAHFDEHVFWGGLTYHAHALCCVAAIANIEVLKEEGLVDNAEKMGRVMRAEMDRLTAKHPSVKEGRQIGLLGMIDIQKNAEGEPLAPYGGAHPAMAEFNEALREKGLFTYVRWSGFFCNPPLCITEEQLREGFAIIDECLSITDEAFES